MIEEVVKICGASKSDILKRLERFAGRGVTFDVSERCLDAKIVMKSSLDSAKFDEVKCAVYNEFESEVYSATDIELHELAAHLLKINGRTLAVAESLTGGEICSRLTSVAGISENFYEGIVCYNRESKIFRLGVSRNTLIKYGAISRETAYEMVKGLLRAPVDIALSTTGLAGPDGDEGKPVGLVYIAVGGGDFVPVFERRFEGTRNEIRMSAANVALFYLVRYLKGDIWRL